MAKLCKQHAMSGDTFLSTKTTTNLVGHQLGDYRIRRHIGQGGMAEVYLGEQLSLCRSVAVKVLKPQLALDDSYVRRFHREAQAAASLVHANIVQIHEVNCIDNYHVIVQEYVPGENLKQILQRTEGLEPSVALYITRQVATALAKAHSQGLVHRDIKPENILISTDGMVKVADFGLARITDDRRTVELTEVGITMGTPLYMSPEQVEGQTVDQRSDIYSLGVTLYHMLSGSPPFDGETPLNVAVKHLKEKPRPLSEVRSGLPDRLCRLTHRMLEKRPENRFENVATLSEELLQIPIEGPPLSWPQSIGLSTQRDTTITNARFAETQQLALAMRNADRKSTVPIWLGWLFAGLFGATAAWAMRPTDPLHVAPNSTAPAKGEQTEMTILEHYESAIWVSPENFDQAEKALLSVIEFPLADGKDKPLDNYYRSRARQQLARLYMSNSKWDQLLFQCQELSSLDATEEEFIAFGLAGEAIASFFLDDPVYTADTLSRFNPALIKQLEQNAPDMYDRLLPVIRVSYLIR